MKKSIFIILLAMVQGACATQQPFEAGSHSLLSFAQLATEITVGYEEIDAQPAPDAVRAENMGSP